MPARASSCGKNLYCMPPFTFTGWSSSFSISILTKIFPMHHNLNRMNTVMIISPAGPFQIYRRPGYLHEHPHSAFLLYAGSYLIQN